MKYRPHRRLLDESMAEVIDLTHRRSLVEHLAKSLEQWGIDLTDGDVRVEPYGYDERIGWDTYIVTIRNKQQQLPSGAWYFGEAMGPDYFGAIGFTDGPGEEAMNKEQIQILR
jgi:hypothetical protein